MKIYIYILIMFIVSILIRTLPMAIFKKPIENKFIKSFLYYVPYVTLSVMTFPAIMNATENPLAGILSLLVGIFLAYIGAKLLTVAISCSVIVLIFTLLI